MNSMLKMARMGVQTSACKSHQVKKIIRAHSQAPTAPTAAQSHITPHSQSHVLNHPFLTPLILSAPVLLSSWFEARA